MTSSKSFFVYFVCIYFVRIFSLDIQWAWIVPVIGTDISCFLYIICSSPFLLASLALFCLIAPDLLHYWHQINIFWTSGFDSVSILFDSLSVGRRSPEFLVFDLGVPSSDLEWIYIWFMALVPLALDIFRLWFAWFQQKAL